MTVPSLNLTTAAAYRPSYQDYLSKSRQNEHENRARWDETSKYFQNNQIRCTKNSQWGSEHSFHQSLESFATEQYEDLNKDRLALRRRLLKQLLVEEDKLFYTELNNYNIQITDRGYQDYLETTRTANTGYTNRTQRTAPNTPQTGKIDSMRRRVEELQSAREEKRRQIAEAKIHQHWRENNPDIRALELEQHQKHVVDQWQDQVEDRSQQRLNEEIYNREQDRLMEEARQNALALMAEEEARRREEQKNLGSDLVQQMEELKLREQEAQQMRLEQEQLLQEQWKLQELEGQRAALEKQRAGFELGRFLLQQYRTQLRRRFEQHKVERQQDIEILENLFRMQQSEDVERTELQKARFQEIQEALQMARQKQQKDVEAEKELDLIYRDEAERLWRKREAEWAAEQAARANLLQAVLNERAQQVDEKLSRLEVAKRENMEEREKAIREMQILRMEAEAEELEKEEVKVARKEDLEAAITARREAAISARIELQQELERQKQQEQEMKELVEEERRVITQRGYQPKTYAKLKTPNVMNGGELEDLETLRSPHANDVIDTPTGGGRRRPQSNSQQRHFVNNIWDTGKNP
ncbi:trichoplein keratin filament-binding protein-like [Symsagittifera roscoffensis]|uniref:trichoplein keratin filament-binding protein-like n=1 Tax=Symsagittifera roscoffensis TaxID=84072 RepID=UPI00307CB5AA